MNSNPRLLTIRHAAIASLAILAASSLARAQTVDPYYASQYNIRNLGAVPDLPGRYGGLTLKAGDPNTLLIGGDGNSESAKIYQIALVRGANGHITGYSGSAAYFANAPGLPASGGGLDGGLIYGPGNVLLYASYSDGSIGQIKPGQTTVAKQTDLSTIGIDGSPGSLVIVPAGMPGAGRLKILTYDSAKWYDTTLSADGNGTFTLAPVTGSVALSLNFGLEGAFYVAAGNPKFPNHSVLVADYAGDRILSFEVNANGDPLPATQRNFITNVFAAEGAAVDPLTGDFLFSSFNGDAVYVVGGFGVAAPTVAITSPTNNEAFAAPGSFNILADADQPGGTVSEVRFYVNDALVGTDTEAPYNAWSGSLSPGTHALKAVAWGNSLSTTSSAVNITVINPAPNVAIASPADNAVRNECGEVLLTTTATDNGTVTGVEYYLNSSVLLDARTVVPYLLVASLPAGTNRLTAVATDNLGARGTSAVVRVVITPVPTNAMSANLLGSGQLKLCFRGLVNSNYVFEFSADLTDPNGWTPFITNTAPASQAGLISTLEAMQPIKPARFFRARKQP